MKRIALLACLPLLGCASFRAVVRDWHNDDLVGQQAPAIGEGVWVGEEVVDAGDWYLVAFLLPL